MFCLDNYDMWEARESRMEQLWQKRPVCDRCSKRITEEVYEDDGETVCEKCLLKRHLRLEVEYD